MAHVDSDPRPFVAALRWCFRLSLAVLFLGVVSVALLRASGVLVVPTAGAQGSATAVEEGREGPTRVARLEAGVVRDVVTLLFGETSILDGTVPDLFSAGRWVEVNGTVEDNAFVACQVAELTGTIGGDAFVVCEVARVTGSIAGDVYASCKEMVIAPGATVGGNVYTGCETLRVEGGVVGTVSVGAGRLFLEGTVGRDVDAAVGALTVSPDARIGGDLWYTTPDPVEFPEGVVAGEIEHRAPAEGGNGGAADDGPGLFGTLFGHGMLYLGTLLLSVTLLRLFRPALVRSASALADAPTRGVVTGFVVVILFVAVVSIGMLFTLGGLGIGSFGRVLTLGGLLLAPFYLAVPVTGLCLGRWLQVRVGGRGDADGRDGELGAIATGLLLLQAAGAIPFLGALVALGVACAGVGGLFLAARGEGDFVGDGATPAT